MDVREKLALTVCNATQNTNYKCEFDCEKKGKCAYCLVMAEQMIAHGVTVQEWISASEPPKETGEYIVAQKHWSDGHLETKKGKWNGVEWLVDGRESLRVAYWMPLPQPPKGE